MTMHVVIQRSIPQLRTVCRSFSCSTARLTSKNDDYKEVQPPPREHPFNRATRILKHDVKSVFTNKQPPLLEFSTFVDIVIIGGGVMGSSIAYWLKHKVPQKDGLRISVIEKDPTYTRCSTTLSVGGLRQQFSLKENIEMSMFGAKFLREVPTRLAVQDHLAPDVQFNPQGYLFLATESGVEQLQENYKLQMELGAKIQLLTRTKLKERFPWLNVDDIELGSIGVENEGWFDPWALLFALKQKAMSLGVEYVKADVVGFEFTEDTGRVGAGMEVEDVHTHLDKLIVRTESGELKTIKFGICVLAAGQESGKVAEMARIGRRDQLLSVPLPVEPRKRYVYCFHSPDGPGIDCPLVVDPSGAYFRREGYAGLYIAGQSPPLEDEPNTDTLDVDYSYFDNVVWPNIANRVPSFQNLKIKSAWAGFYDYNSFDQNAIIGPHPYHSNLYFATGFSGHGIQQAPAVGRAIMESIIDGEYRTIDLNRFHFDRFIVGKEVKEQNIV